MFKKMKKNQKGFTLVELVVVIAILAVLSALVIPRIMGNVENATREREIADARTMASEIAVFNAEAKAEGTTMLANPVTSANTALLTALGITATDIPDSTYVTITIDADGNPEVIEAGVAAPAPTAAP